jgi:hypothetical protein
LAQLQAVQAGHFPVRNHDLETMLVEQLKRGQPVRGNIHLVALIPQKVAHKMSGNGIVVDHQHSHNRSASFIRILHGSTAREGANRRRPHA